ncbi:hypothetical protein [Actinophytocola gossypii]|uniref:Helix-turn-helix domain-containing protein n=1 Tax=Actinophytocola gossypii TaxID=2812003 RepID=A0ABT2JBD8_9PSEU|nr:hypothetical protein [Actinophytocola gossypii]MCT2584884.1 hypothetical protein [Actinophytocola gossypii]
MARAKYTPEARRLLGKVVRQARIALGYTSHESFGAAVGRSARSIYGLEKGESGVGRSVWESVGYFLGQHLRGWSIDTPEAILAGEPVPELELIDPDKPAKARMDVAFSDAKADITALVGDDADADVVLRRVVHWRSRFRTLGLSDSDLFTVVAEAVKAASRTDDET